MHGTATRYNVMYNGKNAYNVSKEQLDKNYKDDFSKILPIEPLQLNEETVPIPKDPKNIIKTNNVTNNNNSFSKAEEKAVKAIQKHSMNIGGFEKNKQIDKAYLLLGKSRYYDQRFVPALETFKYIINHYPKSPLFNNARIWEAKCLTRLGVEEEAKYKLNLVLELEETSDQIKTNALTALALTYSKQDSIQTMINLLDSTLLYKTKDYNQKARNLYILGQLYRKEHKIDSSNFAFNRLINSKKSPYQYKVHAQIEKAKNYNKSTDDKTEIISTLTKLCKNRDNRPFLDEIYYQLGKIYTSNNEISLALTNFEKSLRTKESHDRQKILTYEEIGNLKFNQANFVDAGSYYDSVLNLTNNKNSKQIRKLIRKRKSLDEVIRLENISKRNDSILSLISMNKNEQVVFFEQYIKELKNKDEEAKTIAENKKSSGFGGQLLSLSSKQSVKKGSFYFYNPQIVNFGQIEFKNIWGDRSLVDNWRVSTKQSIIKTSSNIINTPNKIDSLKRYNPYYYVSRIPSNKNNIDSIKNQRNYSYYKLGLIYKEKFKNNKLSTIKLEKLLSFEPKEKLILPTYYHLFKAFKPFNKIKSDFYKNKLISNYPNTQYAEIIKNPKIIFNKKNNQNSPEKNYRTTYTKFIDKQYKIVLFECNKYSKIYENNPISAKFELLRAYAIAKTSNKDNFIKALSFVATNYPSVEEGIHAKKILSSLKKNKKNELKNKKSNKTELLNNKKSSKLPSNKKMLELIKIKEEN